MPGNLMTIWNVTFLESYVTFLKGFRLDLGKFCLVSIKEVNAATDFIELYKSHVYFRFNQKSRVYTS